MSAESISPEIYNILDASELLELSGRNTMVWQLAEDANIQLAADSGSIKVIDNVVTYMSQTAGVRASDSYRAMMQYNLMKEF